MESIHLRYAFSSTRTNNVAPDPPPPTTRVPSPCPPDHFPILPVSFTISSAAPRKSLIQLTNHATLLLPPTFRRNPRYQGRSCYRWRRFVYFYKWCFTSVTTTIHFLSWSYISIHLRGSSEWWCPIRRTFVIIVLDMTRDCTDNPRDVTASHETSISASRFFPLQFLSKNHAHSCISDSRVFSRAAPLYAPIEPNVFIFSGHTQYRSASGGITLLYGNPCITSRMSPAQWHRSRLFSANSPLQYARS